MEIQRVRVPKLYDPLYEKPSPLVPRNLRFEVDERLDANGRVIRELDLDQLNELIEKLKKEDIEAIAICFLHSFVNPTHEEMVETIIKKEFPECFVSISSQILPQKREYERTSTTVINSYVGPPVSRYLFALIQKLKQLMNKLKNPLSKMQITKTSLNLE